MHLDSHLVSASSQVQIRKNSVIEILIKVRSNASTMWVEKIVVVFKRNIQIMGSSQLGKICIGRDSRNMHLLLLL